MKKALITGIAGQDGSYLSEHLLSLGYEVHGIVRRNSVPEHQESRIAKLQDRISTHYGDLMDVGGLTKLMGGIQPDEIYNLAAQSHVRISFDIPQYTTQVNALGVTNLLDAALQACPQARIYQASSSEMFGDSVDEDGFQRETTPMTPVSPYGCAKLYSYNLVRTYRSAHSMFASNGILFNHESPRRGSNFVTSKIVKTAVLIKLGMEDKLILGNLDSKRDWGHSRDYVKAMHLILNAEKPDDFVVATGETASVRDFLEITFSKLGLNWGDYVSQDERYMRPQELPYLRGDSQKARSELGWEATETLDTLVTEMIEEWREAIARNKI